jgi:hypothetical protein
MLGDVTVNLKTENPYTGETVVKSLDKRTLPPEYIPIGKATSAFGDIEIYVAPDERGSSIMNNEILISGLHQFRHDLWLDNKTRIKTIINILPTVGVQSQVYPINNQREGFRPTIDPEVNDIEFLLKRINALLERKSIQ